MTTSEIATVLAWHDALNEHDFDTLLANCPVTTSRWATGAVPHRATPRS